MSPGERTPSPLEGVRVVEVGTLVAASTIGANFADFGADVVKVEHPSGDPLRRVGSTHRGVSLFWKYLARGKRCMTLDLGAAHARTALLRLVADADVVIENFRPGTMERWGLGWEDLSGVNPELIMVRLSGFGQDGPYARRPAFGTLAEAMSGFASMNGDPDGPPTLPPPGLADTMCGMVGTWATMMALYHRDVHAGGGQMVDLALYEPMLTLLGPHVLAFGLLGAIPGRSGNRSTTNAPRNSYRTQDESWVVISTSSDRTAAAALSAVGHPEICDEPWFADGQGRAAHAALIDELVGSWIAQRPLDMVLAELQASGVPVAPIYDVAQIAADPHVRARESLLALDDAELDRITLQNVPVRLTATPGRTRWAGRALGADDAQLHAEIGTDKRSRTEVKTT